MQISKNRTIIFPLALSIEAFFVSIGFVSIVEISVRQMSHRKEDQLQKGAILRQIGGEMGHLSR